MEAGFFPPEMPSCFYSEQFARYRNSLSRDFTGLPPLKNGEPAYYGYKSEKANFVFPRFRREDRRHAYINPIAFFFVSKVLSDNYIELRKLNKKSHLSIAPSIFNWSGERALIRPAFESRDAQNSNLNARFELIVEADISAFYHSIYTHVIPWAIHGKIVAKKNRGNHLIGNVIDLLVRNAQDGQTIGLPVGPDTSRLIAEIVGTAIDRTIQKSWAKSRDKWKSGLRTAMRFVDDYTFGCSSTQEAERTIAIVRKSVNEFELELNNSKTRIAASRPFYTAGWREHLKTFLPQKPFDATALNRYFYNVHVIAKENEAIDVVKYAAQNARRIFLDTDSWRCVEDYLLSAYRQSPTIIPVMIEVLITRQMVRGDVSRNLIEDFVNSRIPTLVNLQKIGEIVWFLFLCIALEIPLYPSVVDGLYDLEDGAVALLVADAKRIGLISGKVNFSAWNRSLTQEGLNSSMWLYAYESTLKEINGITNTSHVADHPYFRFLFLRKIEFYRSGSAHFDVQAIIHRRRWENLRRKLQQRRIDEDLAVSIDDFDDDLEAEYDDEDSDAY